MTWRYLAPPATLALFLVIVSTYLLQLLAGGEVVVRAVGLIPARVSDLTALTSLGDGQAVPAWLTLVTYMFLHSDWWHVTMNMAGLWSFGRLAEPLMGTKRFFLTYVASGVFTGLVIVLINPHGTKPAVGASGAICGLLGAFFALQLPRWSARYSRHLLVLAIESACVFGVVSWLLVRTPPRTPDRMSALMWHLIPFVAAWIGVRVWRPFAPRPARTSGQTPATTP